MPSSDIHPAYPATPASTTMFQVSIAMDATPHSTLVVENLHHYVDSARVSNRFLYVLPTAPNPDKAFSAFDEEARQETVRVVNQQFDRYAQIMASHGMVVQDRQFVSQSDSIEESMLSHLETTPSDLLILGMHEPRPTRRPWRITSTSYAIATHSPCAVMVIKTPSPHHKRLKVLVATDGSRHAQQAVANLTRFLPRSTTDIILLTVVSVNYYVLPVVEPYVDYSSLERAMTGKATEMLTQTRNTLEHAGYTITDAYFNLGDPVDQILAEAEKIQADLIVLGSHGTSDRFSRWLLGSVSSKVLEYSAASVAILK